MSWYNPIKSVAKAWTQQTSRWGKSGVVLFYVYGYLVLLLAIPWIIHPLSNGYECMMPGVDEWVLTYEAWFIRTQWIYISFFFLVLVQVVGCTALSAAFMSISMMAGLLTNITFRHNLASVEYPAACDECWGSIYTLDAIYIAWPAIAGVLLFFDSSTSSRAAGGGGEDEPLVSYN
jgi:hypothetical protein